jgi:hypothetical protein
MAKSSNKIHYFNESKKPGEVLYSLRDSTEEEVAEAKAMKEKIKELEAQAQALLNQAKTIRLSCSHQVKYDEDGHTYNVRTCLACGDYSLI